VFFSFFFFAYPASSFSSSVFFLVCWLVEMGVRERRVLAWPVVCFCKVVGAEVILYVLYVYIVCFPIAWRVGPFLSV